MKHLSAIRPLSAILAALLVSTTGIIAAGATLMPRPAQAASASKLGDMTPFRTIAVDVLSLVEKGDLPAATKRIKDLEINWDGAEAGLKPRAASEWHFVDKAIDRALAELRTTKPNAKTSAQSLKDLLAAFDGAR